MTVQTLKLGGKRFVVLPEKDFRALTEKAKEGGKGKSCRLTGQDRADIAQATRRLNDPNDKPIPWEVARQNLGL